MTDISVALVRGPNLNQWELQNYQFLHEQIHLRCFYSRHHYFPLPQWCDSESLNTIPGAVGTSIGNAIIRRLITRQMTREGGNGADFMLGLDERLKRYDIVHTAELNTAYSGQAARSRLKGKYKHIVTVWENIPFLNYSNSKARIIADTADYFLPVSHQAALGLEMFGVPKSRYSVVPMGVDTEIFKPLPHSARTTLRTERGITDDQIVFLTVARAVWEKGILDALGALWYLNRIEPGRAVYLWVGQGPMIEKVRLLTKKMGLENNFKFIEGVSYEQMPTIYNLADAFVFSSLPTQSWQEQWGMALVEAMSCGLPVISANSGAIPEVMEGTENIFYSAGNYEALGSHLATFVRSHDLANAQGEKNRAHVLERLNSRKISQTLSDIYRKMT